MLRKIEKAKFDAKVEDTPLSWLPWLNPKHIDIINAFGNTPLSTTVFDDQINIRPSVSDVQVLQPVTFEFTIDNCPAKFLCPTELISKLFSGLRLEKMLENPDSLQRSILFQYTLEKQLNLIEQQLNATIEFRESHSIEQNFTVLQWRVEIDGAAYDAELHLSQEATKLVIDRLTGQRNPIQFLNLPFTLSLCAGTQTLTFSELNSLEIGDIVLRQQKSSADYLVVVGNSFSAFAKSEGNKITLTQPLQQFPNIQDVYMSTTSKEKPQPADLTNLDDLPVQLLFEVGRLDLPFSEISKLHDGSVIPISLTAAGDVNIIANGKLIGEGQLVRVGDGLGVKVVRLSADG